ncbi:MAG: ABC transporter permease [Candidatus Saganbacteria bacterium]|nr:ABC transporter permease [Candidatus Saganbacteria bacterium]
MGKYLLKRLLILIPLLIGISLISFFVMHLAPGDPTALFTDPNVKPQELARIRVNWGLDKPVAVQYFYWLGNALRGDLGTAYLINRPVTEVIFERLPATLLLMGTSILLTVFLAVPLGVISALKKNKLFDHVVTVFSFVGMSMPSFWLALMLMLLFSVNLNILPATGMYDPLMKAPSLFSRSSDLLRHMALPVMTMVIISLAGITRYTRASMIEVLGQNYIKAARAKGLPERTVLFKHALRNAMLPLITLVGMMLPDLFAGAFIIETIFAWPGMGRLGVTAVFSRNYPVIMGVVMISAFLIVIGNLLADLCYAAADPRIKIEK